MAHTSFHSASGPPLADSTHTDSELCISSAEAAPKAGINVTAGMGERSKSFLDNFLMEIHDRGGHQSSCFLPFIGLLAIHQNLQTVYVSFGEGGEEQIILVSISSTEHGKGQEIQECPNRLLRYLSQETLQLNILSQLLCLLQSFLFFY